MAEQNVTLPVSGPAGTVSPIVEGIAGVGGATRQVTAPLDYPKTPTPLLADTIMTGGTAIIIAEGPTNGGWVTNPYSATDQNIASPPGPENAFINMISVPGLVGNGTTLTLYPGQNFDIPALAEGVIVRINAATTGHKFSGSLW